VTLSAADAITAAAESHVRSAVRNLDDFTIRPRRQAPNTLFAP
jgi:hypothetical protein